MLLLLLSLLAPRWALAQGGVKAARKAIAETMDAYAKDKDADKADMALLEAISLCGNDCKPGVLARAWMYIGLVKGGGSKDWDTAREAFSVALGFDPKVELDPRFFTPTAQALFDGIRKQQAETKDPSKVVANFEPGTQMGCFPLVQEVETFRPVPISCSTQVADVAEVVLRYRAYGAERWTRVELEKKGDEWLGQIPCTELSRPGTWGMYIEAKNDRDIAVERIGSRDKPLVFKVVEESSEPPPALPGQKPPDRCVATTYCPEDMIGTPACDELQGGKTSAVVSNCSESSECDLGMECVDGSCKAAGVCVDDADCAGDGEVCRGGLCELPESASKLDWFGIHFGTEFASLAGERDVCGAQASGYACFDSSAAYDGTPYPGQGGAVTSGLHPGTMRVMLSYERFVVDQLSLGVRFGFAFSGAPEDFFPLHFEGRGTYYFTDVTRGRGLFAPYVAVGFGLAQVDSRVEVQMVDCLPGSVQQCLDAPEVNEDLVGDGGAARLRSLDAYKTLGQAFGILSPGVMINLSRQFSLVANVGVMLMTEEGQASSIIFAFQPSLGVALGL